MFHVVLIIAFPSLLVKDGGENTPRPADAPVPLLTGADEMIDTEFADRFGVTVTSIVIVVLVVGIVR